MTGAAVGTAAYMSPEQATGGRVDARTDLFSFGSVLYEMATGRRAFPGDNSGTVIMRLLKGEFIPPRSLNPAIPGAARDDHPARDGGRPEPPLSDARGMLEDLRVARRACWRPTGRSTAARSCRRSSRRSRGRSGSGRRAWRSALPRSRCWPARSAGAGHARRHGDGADQPRQHPDRRLRQQPPAMRCSTRRFPIALKVQLGQSPFLDIVPDDRIAEELG